MKLIKALDQNQLVQHLSVEDALDSSRVRNFGGRMVWFYRAPWSLPWGSDTADVSRVATEELASWLKHHRALLRSRRALGSKLLLVNVDRPVNAELFELLGVPRACADIFEQDEGIVRARALSKLLAHAFDAVLPDHWDMFEVLDALSWRPGEMVQDASDRIVTTEADLIYLLQRLFDADLVLGLKAALDTVAVQAKQQAMALSNVHAELATERDNGARELAGLQKALKQASDANASLMEDLAASQSENRELTALMHKAQEEFERTYVDGQAQLASLQTQHADLKVEVAGLKAALKDQTDKLATATAAANNLQTEKGVAVAESEKLVSELKKALAEKTVAAGELKNAMSELKNVCTQRDAAIEALQKIKSELSTLQTEKSTAISELKKVNSDFELLREQNSAVLAALAESEDIGGEQQRALELAFHDKERLLIVIEQGKTQANEARKESEMLLLQMHQVQEELERYFLENRSLQKKLVEANQSMDRSRQMISRLIPAQMSGLKLASTDWAGVSVASQAIA